MKIILNQDVQNLGEEGDVRDVARGYARNYLFRKGLAVPYNKQNVALFEHKKSAIEKRKEEKRQAASSLKTRVEALTLEMTMPAGDTGKLFGSVTAAALAEELEKHGINVEKKKIDIPGNTIKMVGDYTFTVRLYEDEAAECKVSILAEKRSAGKKAAKEEPAAEESTADEAVGETDADEVAVEESVDEAPAEEAAAEEPSTDEDAADESLVEENVAEEVSPQEAVEEETSEEAEAAEESTDDEPEDEAEED